MKKKIVVILLAIIINIMLVLLFLRQPIIDALENKNNPAVAQLKNALPDFSFPALSLPDGPTWLPSPDTTDNNEPTAALTSTTTHYGIYRTSRDAQCINENRQWQQFWQWKQIDGSTKSSDAVPALDKVVINHSVHLTMKDVYLKLEGDGWQSSQIQQLSTATSEVIAQFNSFSDSALMTPLHVTVLLLPKAESEIVTNQRWQQQSEEQAGLWLAPQLQGEALDVVNYKALLSYSLNRVFFGELPAWLDDAIVEGVIQQSSPGEDKREQERRQLIKHLMKGATGKTTLAKVLVLEASDRCKIMADKDYATLLAQ